MNELNELEQNGMNSDRRDCGWTGIEEDYPISAREVIDITAETGALTTQSRVLELKPYKLPERKKGRWIPVDSYTAFGGDKVAWYSHGNPIAFYYCSECKKQAYADENGDSLLTKFCPNCGNPMEVVHETD